MVSLKCPEPATPIQPGGAPTTPGVDTFGLYAVLGITPDASPQVVRRAFTESRSAFAEAEEDMTPEEIAVVRQLDTAQRVLSDPIRRALYDRHGEAALVFLRGEYAADMSDQLGLHVTVTYVAFIAVWTIMLAIIQLGLIAGKVDDVITSTWGSVLAPLWIFDVILVLNLGTILLARSNDDLFRRRQPQQAAHPGQPHAPGVPIGGNVPGQAPQSPVTPVAPPLRQTALPARAYLVAGVICTIAFVICTALMGYGLTHQGSVSAYAPLVPALIGEVAVLVISLPHTKLCWVRAQLLAEGLRDLPQWPVVVVGVHRFIIITFRIALYILAALRYEGSMSDSWQKVAIPVYIFLGTSLLSMFSKLWVKFINNKLRGINFAVVMLLDLFATGLLATGTGLFAWRLDDGSAAPDMVFCTIPWGLILLGALIVALALLYFAATFTVETDVPAMDSEGFDGLSEGGVDDDGFSDDGAAGGSVQHATPPMRGGGMPYQQQRHMMPHHHHQQQQISPWDVTAAKGANATRGRQLAASGSGAGQGQHYYTQQQQQQQAAMAQVPPSIAVMQLPPPLTGSPLQRPPAPAQDTVVEQSPKTAGPVATSATPAVASPGDGQPTAKRVSFTTHSSDDGDVVLDDRRDDNGDAGDIGPSDESTPPDADAALHLP